MIQRIQTLYLLAVVLIAAACTYLSLSGAVDGQIIIKWADTAMVYVGAALCALLCCDGLICIFFYKYRKSQMALCLSMMFTTLATLFFYFWTVAALPFIFLAWRAIRADERLIRSIDRIR